MAASPILSRRLLLNGNANVQPPAGSGDAPPPRPPTAGGGVAGGLSDIIPQALAQWQRQRPAAGRPGGPPHWTGTEWSGPPGLLSWYCSSCRVSLLSWLVVGVRLQLSQKPRSAPYDDLLMDMHMRQSATTH